MDNNGDRAECIVGRRNVLDEYGVLMYRDNNYKFREEI